MVGKLMKFDYRSSFRKIAPLWIGLIACSIIFGGSARVIEYIRGTQDILFLALLATLLTIVFGALMVAVAVTALITIIGRFKDGLLGDEGYLMNTLPVTTRQLIISKGLVATTVIIVSVVVMSLSGTIAAALSGMSNFKLSFDFSAIGKGFLMGVLLIILIIIKVLSEIYKIYAAMAIAQLSDTHRTIKALLAYLGINIAMSTLAMILGVGGYKLKFFGLVSFFQGLDQMTGNYLAVLFMIVIFAVELLIYHIIVEAILKKKLNLL